MISTIKSDFDKVLAYSQNIKEPINSDKILDTWYSAKKHFIDRWDGALIKEYGEVVFELSSEEKKRRLNEFIDLVEGNCCQYELAAFLSANHKDFFTNRLSQDYTSNLIGTKIQKGTKIVKAFKYFVEDEKLLSRLQTQASMIIQEDKVSGIFCMSVHPLDYLSLSENNHNWRSCHALDGDYRAGNLSYMVDRSTVICYLKHDGAQCKLPHFPEDVLWNSKKWRMLLFEEDYCDALFAGRQYPFFSPTALDVVRKHYLEDKGGVTLWSDWHKDFMIDFPREKSCNHRDERLGGRYISLGGHIYNMDNLVIDAQNSLHYNDLKFSSCYMPYYCWSYYPHNPRFGDMKFHIGSSVPCVCCGDEIDMEGSMLCMECNALFGEGENDYFGYCDCCETRVPRSELTYLSGSGAQICQHCYDEYAGRCEVCGDTYYRCELTYDEDDKEWKCHYCYEHRNKKQQTPAPKINFEFDFTELPF